MGEGILLLLKNLLLGVGVGMDAFSVSLANGLQEVRMRPARICGIAATFAAFQFFMPLCGRLFICTLAARLALLARALPLLAPSLLTVLGLRMLLSPPASSRPSTGDERLSLSALLVQGCATSLDALTLGFTLAEQTAARAVFSALTVGGVTFFLCLFGLLLGKRLGKRVADRAGLLGGVILFGVGLHILIRTSAR